MSVDLYWYVDGFMLLDLVCWIHVGGVMLLELCCWIYVG